MVILTSFKKSREIIKQFNIPEQNVYSVARFQPKGYRYRELPFLSATDENGNKLLLRYFDDPIRGYADALKKGYKARWGEIRKWLNGLNENENIVLCCWCPHSSQTQNQIETHGTFCCHTGLIGRMINRHRPDITVILDDERAEKLIPQWKPDVYKRIEECGVIVNTDTKPE